MIMTISTITLMTIMIMMMENANNPMKTSFLMLVSSFLMFLQIKMETGNTWFPLVFFILFTGGILMMFMILSSILPNEKALKLKYPKMVFVPMCLMTPLIYKQSLKSESLSLMKSFLYSGLIFSLMMLIILLYFFNSISLNTAENYSMRSFQCC